MPADIFANRRKNIFLFLAFIAALTTGSMVLTQFDPVNGLISILKAFFWGLSNFYPDVQSLSHITDILVKLRDTILMSIASSVAAAVLAMALALMGSRSTRIHVFFTYFSRGIGSFFRNVPLVAWAMVLMLSFSQSSLTGFLALFFGSLGFLTRAFMETLDEVGESTVEALKATGAAYYHIIFQAVLPSSLPQMLSWLLFMIETNIRDATLVGFLTGTGIGFLFDVYYKSFNYHVASLIVIVTVITVIAMESISNMVRREIL
ncbi:MAG: ABC transporter permease subunit [Brevinematales bacterium]|jgi:phosphonate transport system permease protein